MSLRIRVLLVTILLLATSDGPGVCSAELRGETLLAVNAMATEPLALVVNRSNSVDGLTSAELKRIFLGRRTYWSNGRRITLVMREPGSDERNTILRDVCSMTEDQFKNHFLHGLYTGEILVSPKILLSSAGVRKFIFNVPGAIGYVPVHELDDTIKVIRIDEELPGDKGYKFKVPAGSED